MEISRSPLSAQMLAPILGRQGDDPRRQAGRETQATSAGLYRREMDRSGLQDASNDPTRVLRGEYLSSTAHGQEHNPDPHREGKPEHPAPGFGQHRSGSPAQQAAHSYATQEYIDGPSSVGSSRYIDMYV